MCDRTGPGVALGAAVKRIALLLVVVGFGACAEPITEPDRLPASFAATTCSPAACETGPVATATADIDAVIAASTEWPVFDDYTSGCIRASNNIPVTGSVTLVGATHDAKIVIGTRVPLAKFECIGAEYYFDFATCDEVRITDTTIRVRTLTRDLHPAGGYLRTVELIEPCEAGCFYPEAESWCEQTHTCWPDLGSYCRYCLGGSAAKCNCWDGVDSYLPDGSHCSLAVSGDLWVEGRCYSGTCEEY